LAGLFLSGTKGIAESEKRCRTGTVQRGDERHENAFRGERGKRFGAPSIQTGSSNLEMNEKPSLAAFVDLRRALKCPRSLGVEKSNGKVFGKPV